MKKFLAMMMAMMMAFGVAACGGSEEPVDEPADEVVEEVVEDTADGGADGFTLWDVATVETPVLEGTDWDFCGGYMDDTEMTQEEYDATIEMYGGKLQFVFNEDGTAEMVQGGGSLNGYFEYIEGGVGVEFDNNGEALRYSLIFIDLDGLTMVALPDNSGEFGLYFMP